MRQEFKAGGTRRTVSLYGAYWLCFLPVVAWHHTKANHCLQDTLLTRRGNLTRRATKEAVDEAVKAAMARPFLELSGNLSDYRHKVRPQWTTTLTHIIMQVQPFGQCKDSSAASKLQGVFTHL